jgi:cytidylate kinase
VSAVPAVRARLVAIQRQAVAGGGIVMEGRDIGTVVLPQATLKVFLTASDQARAGRRAAELPGHGDVADVLASVASRDHLDSSRTISPLRRADDAVEIDATHLSLEQVVERVTELVLERVSSTSGSVPDGAHEATSRVVP